MKLKIAVMMLLMIVLSLSFINLTKPALHRNDRSNNHSVLRAMNGDGFDAITTTRTLTESRVAVIDTGFNKHLSGLNLIHHGKYNEETQSTHGTFVAGIIGGREATPVGFQGVLPGIKIDGYEIPEEELRADTLANMIDEVSANGADVLNISLGIFKYDEKLFQSVRRAIDKGIVIVASSGNGFSSAYNYPASFPIPGVISVGALDHDLNILPSTNVNDRVDIYALGDDIVSISEGPRSGTSVAAPFVTALVAMVKAECPQWSPAKVEEIIVDTSHSYTASWGAHKKRANVLNFHGALEQCRCHESSE